MIQGRNVVDLMLTALRRERAVRPDEPLDVLVRHVWDSQRANVDPIAMAALRETGQAVLDREGTPNVRLSWQWDDLAFLSTSEALRDFLGQ